MPARTRQRHATERVLQLLQAYESRHVTCVEPDGSWPIVWEQARGVHVWDADGKKYLDLTAAFGVAAAGHANPAVVRAGQRQMHRLLHAMGDVHPHALKAHLARELSRITFERWNGRTRGPPAPSPAPASDRGKTVFCNSGFEAVETAFKTALLATGKPGVIAFQGAYHGLGYGALNATHRAFFRAPFEPQLGGFACFVPFPMAGEADDATLGRLEAAIRRLFRRQPIGAILAEPIQGRAGLRVPPAGFLPLLRQLADEKDAVLILDEIYTGFGRTGRWFACEHSRTRPDLICLGKALTGGFPLSACVGRAELMDAAWPESRGEALHTSTFLGHPVGCAMALAQIRELTRRGLVERSARLGADLHGRLQAVAVPARFRATARGLGLMVGLELCRSDGTPATGTALQVVKTLLHRGFILLPEGEHANILAFTPPLTITRAQLAGAVRAVAEALHLT